MIHLDCTVSDEHFTVENAPAGLLMLRNGTILCKSERFHGQRSIINVNTGLPSFGNLTEDCRQVIVRDYEPIP